MLEFIEYTGKKYRTDKSTQKYMYAKFRCHCGKIVETRYNDVIRGDIKSCGCSKYKNLDCRTHGMSHHRLFNIWQSMKERCLNSNSSRYKDWGGRGITICDEWKNSSIVFFEWALNNGYADNLQIDRIDNDGDYGPSNCRFVTPSVNSSKRRKRSDNKSGFIGVSRECNKYIVQIRHNGLYYRLSPFKTPMDAAIARNEWILQHNTEHTLNTISIQQ